MKGGGGGGLAPCKVKCPPRRVQGHAPLENFGIIHSNFLQSESKILMLDLRGSVYCAFVCMKCHWQVFRISMFTCSDVAHAPALRSCVVWSQLQDSYSAYGACQSSGSFCLRGGTTAPVASPPLYPPLIIWLYMKTHCLKSKIIVIVYALVWIFLYNYIGERSEPTYVVVQCARIFSISRQCYTLISNLAINVHNFAQRQRWLPYTLRIVSQQCIAFF